MYTTVFYQPLGDIVYAYHSVLSTSRWYRVCIPQCFYQPLGDIMYVYYSVYQPLGDIVYVYHSVFINL